MDSPRQSQGQLIAAASGVVLIISLFLKWKGLDVPGGGSLSGWKTEDALDIYLLILGLIAIAGAMGQGDDLPYLTAESKVLTAVIGLVLMIFVLLFHGDGIELKFGFWLALLATVGVTVGQFQAMNEQAR
jgi:UDP-N-acetylmuramyl pentapeptide phosphotransferase/UDP-N-acetylglucosamine-1-phosphate transferase